jgi:hypothetical protein
MESWIRFAGIIRGLRIAWLNKERIMDEEPKQNQPNKPKASNNAGRIILWLLFAFVPSIVTIPLIYGKNVPTGTGNGLVTLAIICSLCSGFGVLRGVKSPTTRILLGVLLAGVFFVLNAFIVILVGCTTNGSI